MRERLIGAIVLVVIAVILVPWLVSRAHHPEDVVTHKSWPASARTPQQPYVLPLQATRTVAARKAPVQGTSSATSKPRQNMTQPSARPVTHAAAGVARASETPPARHDTAASESGSGKAPAIKQGTTSTGWSIQAASFSDIKSAKALADKLEQAGFNVGLSSHTVKGTLYYQVRVGPYPSEKLARDAAPGVARISNTKVLVRSPGSDNG